MNMTLPTLAHKLRTNITEAVARGWCADGNTHKVMDPTLASAIVDEVMAVVTYDCPTLYVVLYRDDLGYWCVDSLHGIKDYAQMKHESRPGSVLVPIHGRPATETPRCTARSGSDEPRIQVSTDTGPNQDAHDSGFTPIQRH
jgi:hypothetical protein